MGDQFFVLIVFAGVAAFLVYRMWGVLGRKPGAEPPPVPPGLRQPGKPASGTVIPLPDRGRPVPSGRVQTPLATGLAEIAANDPNFTPDRFVDGARHAFEIIVKAFAEGDTATLRPLVSDEVYDAFAEVIRHRLSVRESVETRVERLQDPDLVEARMDGRTAVITMKFVSGQVSVTRDGAGKLLDGDADRAVEHTDYWTFTRNTRSSDPNWVLVGTGAPE